MHAFSPLTSSRLLLLDHFEIYCYSFCSSFSSSLNALHTDNIYWTEYISSWNLVMVKDLWLTQNMDSFDNCFLWGKIFIFTSIPIGRAIVFQYDCHILFLFSVLFCSLVCFLRLLFVSFRFITHPFDAICCTCDCVSFDFKSAVLKFSQHPFVSVSLFDSVRPMSYTHISFTNAISIIEHPRSKMGLVVTN